MASCSISPDYMCHMTRQDYCGRLCHPVKAGCGGQPLACQIYGCCTTSISLSEPLSLPRSRRQKRSRRPPLRGRGVSRRTLWPSGAAARGFLSATFFVRRASSRGPVRNAAGHIRGFCPGASTASFSPRAVLSQDFRAGARAGRQHDICGSGALSMNDLARKTQMSQAYLRRRYYKS